MPRQSISTTGRQSIPPLNLEEIKFWLDIMQEHAVFIKAGLPADNVALISEAQRFYEEFGVLREKAERVQSERKFTELIAAVQDTVRDFLRYKRELLRMALTCTLGGWNFPLFLDHMAREAEYVLRLTAAIQPGIPAFLDMYKAQETVFWIRIMENHTEFVDHLLDPSERSLICTVADFSTEFDQLYLQGRDFISMLRSRPSSTPAFDRFVQDARVATLRLRDFKKALHKMITECRVLGLIPALLADHIRKEADHFLMILALVERGMLKDYCPETSFAADYAEEPVTDEQVIVEEEECPPEIVAEFEEQQQPFKVPKYCPPPIEGQISAEAETDEFTEDVEFAPPAPPPPILQPEPKAGKQKSKYKWSGHWPRPLGKVKE